MPGKGDSKSVVSDSDLRPTGFHKYFKGGNHGGGIDRNPAWAHSHWVYSEQSHFDLFYLLGVLGGFV